MWIPDKLFILRGCVKNDSLSDVDFIYSLQDVVDSPGDVLKEKKEKKI